MIGRLAVRCPAKINTRLRVVGRRPDGYHELDTDFVGLALSDTLELDREQGFRLELAGSESGLPIDDNLVLRGARLLQDEVGRDRLPGARLRLTKRIPIAAGLGGGSSDAAGVIVGLDRLWSLGLPPERAAAIALAIGSDVPYFLRGGRQTGGGRGEILSPRPDGPDQPVLLVRSAQGLSTRHVFEEFARQAAKPDASGALTSRKTSIRFENGRAPDPGAGPVNDLLPAAAALAPDLDARLEWCWRALPNALIGLSGSGPTIFILLEAGADVAEAEDRLERGAGEVLATRTMGALEQAATRFTGLTG